ncbi:MAG: hypothetical protein QHJ73_14085 [Armatimonadota bacterium]|nr:hypothetical protein [Armatimonadota bacterium]
MAFNVARLVHSHPFARGRAFWWLLLLATFCPAARADVLLREDFETQGEWRFNATGKAMVSLVDGGRQGKCVKTEADGGTAYYTRQLKTEQVAGRKITVRCWVRLENVRQGPQVYSTAKIHIGARVGGNTLNFADRWVGTTGWQERVLVADLPENVEQVVLDLGIQGGYGVAYYDDLVVEDDQRPYTALSILPAANTSRSDGVAGDGQGGFLDTGFTDLRALPEGEQVLGGIPFTIPAPGANLGVNCIALRGKERPTLPDVTPAPIVVGRKARALYFLHAAGWAREHAEDPCAFYEVTYADGSKENIPIREGVEVFRLDAPRDLPGCKVAWKARTWEGNTVGLGIFRWENPHPDVPIQSLSVRSTGTAAALVLVAVTAER